MPPRLPLLALLAVLAHALPAAAEPAAPSESQAQSAARHALLARRRAAVGVICHRGASEFAHENTLEAYRATFELGADGNEIDVRRTRDGVLVCMHDDTLDAQLHAFGAVADYTLAELRAFGFREPGPYGAACRVPTFAEVLDLHARRGGLIHLDIKEPGLDAEVAALLDERDMWDHVAHCNDANGAAVLRHPRYRPRRYKGQLYEQHEEVDPRAVAAMLARPGDDVIVDDPRGVLAALGRPIGRISAEPVVPAPGSDSAAPADSSGAKSPTVDALLATLGDAADWDRVETTEAEQAESARRITARARAADELLAAGAATPEVFAALEQRVRRRSLHTDWRYHGLDGATALRALVLLRAPGAAALCRETLWSNDPALAKLADPKSDLPRAWLDFRVKQVVFPSLRQAARGGGPVDGAEAMCRDYLALSDKKASALGPPLFDDATKALLAISPRRQTAMELLRAPRPTVRGRAVLVCLAHAHESWAKDSLAEAAPYALSYLPK